MVQIRVNNLFWNCPEANCDPRHYISSGIWVPDDEVPVETRNTFIVRPSTGYVPVHGVPVLRVAFTSTGSVYRSQVPLFLIQGKIKYKTFFYSFILFVLCTLPNSFAKSYAEYDQSLLNCHRFVSNQGRPYRCHHQHQKLQGHDKRQIGLHFCC